MSKERVYGQGKRVGRRVSKPKPGEGKHVQAWLDPETAARFATYCLEMNRRTSELVAEIVRAHFA